MVLISYFFQVMGNLMANGELLAAVSPFHYLDTAVNDPGYGLVGGNVAFYLVLTALFITATILYYKRKDIYV